MKEGEREREREEGDEDRSACGSCSAIFSLLR